MVTLRPHNLFCALALALAVGPAIAQDAETAPRPTPEPAQSPAPNPAQASSQDANGERPKAAQRVVKVFDFEEWLTNALDVPEGWVRAQDDPLVPRVRPGFPIWNLGKLDYEVAANGRGSVRLDIEGGSASLRLRPGVLPIFPMGQYSVRVLVRGEGLVDARPRLTVRALDSRGVPIAESERSILESTIHADWRPMEVVLPGLFPDAAYLQIDLEVVQPREYEAERLPEHRVWAQDFEGTAWFDDVVVMQVPQLALRTTSPLEVVARPEVPVLEVTLRDLAAQDMRAEVRVYDARRRLVDSMERLITSGRTAWEWQPALAELGWYRAVVTISAEGSLVSSETCDFVWVDEPRQPARAYDSGPAFAGAQTDATSRAWRPFGVELSTLPPAEPADLATALHDLGVRSATLPVWEAAVQAETFSTRVELLRELASSLRTAWIETRFSLPTVPGSLARTLRLDRGDIFEVFDAEPAVWEPFLLEALDLLGTTAGRWQLGSAGTTRSFQQSDLAAEVAGARSALAGLVPGVELTLGWRADLSPEAARASGADTVRVELPEWMPTPPFEAMVAPWREQGGPAPEFVLAPLDPAHFTEHAIAADLARRTTELWAQASRGLAREAPPRFGVAIADPWRIEPGERVRVHPTVAAAAWRALADRLDGRVLAVDWPIVQGVRCLVFTAPLDAPNRGGLIIAWRESALPEDAVLVATLGKDAVTVYDLFGNADIQEPTSSEDGARLEQRLRLSDEPIFIEGVDTDLVLFLNSIALNPSQIQATAGEHEHAVTVRNPWDMPITGRIIVTEPGGFDPATQARDRSWEITPRSTAFDLAPGASVEIPLVISFARSTEAGPKSYVFDIQLIADRDYGWVRARSFVELAWNDVWLDLTYRVPPGGAEGDLIIEAVVTNTGDTPRALEAIAIAPGMPRVRSSIGTLQPGQSVIRRFPFPEAARSLAGERVVVSVSEPGGPGRLTKGLDLPGP